MVMIMSKQASRESEMVPVTLCDGRTKYVDPELQTLVQALNDGGFQTTASCFGHGHRPAIISLSDGRELLILRNYEEARSLDTRWPDINGDKIVKRNCKMKTSGVSDEMVRIYKEFNIEVFTWGRDTSSQYVSARDVYNDDCLGEDVCNETQAVVNAAWIEFDIDDQDTHPVEGVYYLTESPTSDDALQLNAGLVGWTGCEEIDAINWSEVIRYAHPNHLMKGILK